MEQVCCTDSASAVGDRSFAAGDKDVGLGKEAEAGVEVVAVFGDDHWVAAYPGSSHLLPQVRSRSAADGPVMIVPWMRRTFVRTWSETVLEALE